MIIEDLGKIDYDKSLTLQLKEREMVKDGKSNGKIFLLEHDPSVITIGRHANISNLLISEDFLKQKGYELKNVSRGGDLTVHEKGQLVVYFVLPIKAKQVRSFVDKIINSIITFLKNEYNLDTYFNNEKPGIWVNDSKICSIGLDLTERVSMHGIALNVENNMEGFNFIVPCGIKNVKITTMKELLGSVTVEEVKGKISKYLDF